MNKRFIAAAVMLCVLGLSPAAHSASSSFSINVKNTSGSTVTLMKGSDLGGDTVLVHNRNKWTRFSTKDTAYYLKTRKHNHDIEVRSGGKIYCALTIWLKNRVEFFGNTKITDYGYSSSQQGRCDLKRDPTSGSDLSMTLTIKKS